MILPYRTDLADLQRFVAGRARGRSLDQLRTLGFAPKSFEGTAAAVEALGLVEDRNGALTEIGRRFAVTTAEEMAQLIRSLLGGFAPYALLMEAVLTGGGPDPTPLGWVETWWATHGFGSSESNRAEGAPVFARLVEAAALGAFVQGRKGRPSRIEWAEGARAAVSGSPAPPLPSAAPLPTAAVVTHAPDPAAAKVPLPPVPPAAAPPELPPASTVRPDILRWHLGAERVVRIEIPADLTDGERARLREMLVLLLAD